MSAKPSAVPQWATSGPVTTPSAGKISSGFAPAERGAAQYFNYLLNLNGLWAQYLNDGAFSGASTFDNTLGVTGLITATAGMTANGLITANAGISVPTAQNITLAGTSLLKHGSRTLMVPANAAMNVSANAFSYTASQSLAGATWGASGAGTFYVTVPLPAFLTGHRILTARAYIKDVNTLGALSFNVFHSNTTGTAATTGGTTATSANNGTNQTLTVSSINYTIGSTDAVYGLLFFTATGAGSGYTFYEMQIDFDWP